MKLYFRFWSTFVKASLGLICAILLAGVLTVRASDPLRARIVYATFRPANTEIYLQGTPGSAPRRRARDLLLRRYSKNGRMVP